MSKYDVIVIGGGPGGYVASIRCAQMGLHTACVEGRDTLGGTCLNVGCIPSKALLHASHQLHEAEQNFEKMGLIAKPPSIDWAKMQNYKTETIDANTKGIEFLFKKNKITRLEGHGEITAPGKVKVGKMNIDENPGTPGSLGVRSIPTLVMFKGGRPVDQVVGAVAKSKLEEMMNKQL